MISKRTTDFESAAKAYSGKFAPSGRPMTVEEDYVAGTNPTNLQSHFAAKIDMAEGFPKVQWEPDLNEDGTKSVRTYKIWGKAALDDDNDWECPTNATHHFFKVTVEMP